MGAISPAPSSHDLGLDLGSDGTLWGVQAGPSVGGGELIQLDTTTAALSVIAELTVPATGQVIVRPSSLAIISSTTAVVPGLSLPLMLVLAVGLSAMGARRLHRMG